MLHSEIQISSTSMSGQIVPKRFGLKYSPKPAIALEYQKPDSGAGGKERKGETDDKRGE